MPAAAPGYGIPPMPKVIEEVERLGRNAKENMSDYSVPTDLAGAWNWSWSLDWSLEVRSLRDPTDA